MYWYLVHTKPKQEKYALQHLEQQGYQCYLPTIPFKRLRQGISTMTNVPLFPRYLFIRLGLGSSAKSWAPIRSTKGVNCLVSFGPFPAKVDDSLIERLRNQEIYTKETSNQLFESGEPERVTEGVFAGLQGIYQITDGERRAMVLIELVDPLPKNRSGEK